MNDWRPVASHGLQRQRAALLSDLRRYFAERDVLEVDTPLLCSSGVTDPALENFVVACREGTRFLQTSPEYAMKRLLAAGSGDIYQICKAFRAEEVGARHNPEYTLLEWYRLGIDHYCLLHEVGELVCALLDRPGWQVWPWHTLVQHALGSGMHAASRTVLERMARQRIGEIPAGLDRDGLLDLLVSHCVEPAIAGWGVVFIVDYPISQAALARRIETPEGLAVGARFECYVDGMELANGYWECGDVEELTARFTADNERRKQRNQEPRPHDPYLLAALASGLPDCSGVAMGVDRLLALRAGAASLDAVLGFDWVRS